MKLKKIFMALIASSIITAGCANETISKEELKTEAEDAIVLEENIEAISKEDAAQIALSSFEKYFGEKIDTKNLNEDINLSPDPSTENPYWTISWTSPDSIDAQNRLIEYMANIDSVTGKLLNISSRNLDLDKESSGLSIIEATKIAMNFIDEHGLRDIDSIHFVANTSGGEMFPQEDESSFYLDFQSTSDESDIMTVEIDKRENKVIYFGGF